MLRVRRKNGHEALSRFVCAGLQILKDHNRNLELHDTFKCSKLQYGKLRRAEEDCSLVEWNRVHENMVFGLSGIKSLQAARNG